MQDVMVVVLEDTDGSAKLVVLGEQLPHLVVDRVDQACVGLHHLQVEPMVAGLQVIWVI